MNDKACPLHLRFPLAFPNATDNGRWYYWSPLLDKFLYLIGLTSHQERIVRHLVAQLPFPKNGQPVTQTKVAITDHALEELSGVPHKAIADSVWPTGNRNSKSRRAAFKAAARFRQCVTVERGTPWAPGKRGEETEYDLAPLFRQFAQWHAAGCPTGKDFDKWMGPANDNPIEDDEYADALADVYGLVHLHELVVPRHVQEELHDILANADLSRAREVAIVVRSIPWVHTGQFLGTNATKTMDRAAVAPALVHLFRARRAA